MSFSTGPPRVIYELNAALARPGKRFLMTLSELDLKSYENKVNLLEAMIEGFKDVKLTLAEHKNKSQFHFEDLAHILNGRDMTEQFTVDVMREVKRLRRVLQFLQIRDLCNILNVIANFPEAKTIYDDVQEILYGIALFTDENDLKVATKLKDLNILAHANVRVGEKETTHIIQVLKTQLGVTRWYKCLNGHYYGVGNCGALNQRGKCPDCKSVIGGNSLHSPLL